MLKRFKSNQSTHTTSNHDGNTYKYEQHTANLTIKDSIVGHRKGFIVKLGDIINKHGSSIVQLSIGFDKLTEDDISTLIGQINPLKQLSTLKLQGNNVNKALILLEGLKKNVEVNSGNPYINQLVTIKNNAPNVTKFTMPIAALTPEALKALKSIIQRNSGLKSLDLSNIKFKHTSDENAAQSLPDEQKLFLKEMLSSNPSLKEIKLPSGKILKSSHSVESEPDNKESLSKQYEVMSKSPPPLPPRPQDKVNYSILEIASKQPGGLSDSSTPFPPELPPFIDLTESKELKLQQAITILPEKPNKKIPKKPNLISSINPTRGSLKNLQQEKQNHQEKNNEIMQVSKNAPASPLPPTSQRKVLEERMIRLEERKEKIDAEIKLTPKVVISIIKKALDQKIFSDKVILKLTESINLYDGRKSDTPQGSLISTQDLLNDNYPNAPEQDKSSKSVSIKNIQSPLSATAPLPCSNKVTFHLGRKQGANKVKNLVKLFESQGQKNSKDTSSKGSDLQCKISKTSSLESEASAETKEAQKNNSPYFNLPPTMPVNSHLLTNSEPIKQQQGLDARGRKPILLRSEIINHSSKNGDSLTDTNSSMGSDTPICPGIRRRDTKVTENPPSPQKDLTVWNSPYGAIQYEGGKNQLVTNLDNTNNTIEVDLTGHDSDSSAVSL